MRLLGARDFERVFKRAFRSSSETLTVLARDNGSEEARLGLAIANKHVRKAVCRNRIKRVIRESFRRHRDRIRGLDVVVLARGGLSELDNRALHATLQSHWRRLARASTARKLERTSHASSSAIQCSEES